MTIRPYNLGDIPELDRWHRAQRGDPLAVEFLPPFGLIEPGVAAGFLSLTDCKVGMLDGFMSNPEAPLRARRDALEAIVSRLTDVAAARGMRRLFGLTTTHGIQAMAKRAGYADRGEYRVMAREA